jgi:hypothetical protein
MTKTLLVLLSVALLGSVLARAEEQSQRPLFEQFKTLQGTWRGHSTKGWENNQSFQVIAKGTAILSVSEFVDNADEGMATVLTMDGPSLLLIHYCEAGNAPVLRATNVEDNGKKITFEFQSGINIPDRNTGHMDEVIFQFKDPDHFSAQWSWYSKGKQQWFENIEYERVR